MAAPLGVYSHLIAPQGGMTLILREKVLSLTGDGFQIKNEAGQDVLKVKPHLASISGRKSISDSQNNHLFDIQKEHFHIHTTFAINNPQGQKIMEVKSSFKLLGSKAAATFKNGFNGADEKLQMSGNFFDSRAEIIDTKTNATVATIQRNLKAADLLFGKQTYTLTINPGVDMALMAAMCICMDEKNNEGGGGFF